MKIPKVAINNEDPARRPPSVPEFSRAAGAERGRDSKGRWSPRGVRVLIRFPALQEILSGLGVSGGEFFGHLPEDRSLFS